jgi:hypothetical protein
MCWKEKIQWQCCPRASERACITFPPLILDKVRSYMQIISHDTLRKWCYTRVQHDFHIDPIISPCQFIFQPFVTWLRENYDYRNVSWEMICIYDLTLSNRCFPDGEHSDVPRLQQVEQKAVGWQRNLGLGLIKWYIGVLCTVVVEF